VEISWLLQLRWLAIVGQLALILVAERFVSSLLLGALLLVIAAVAVSNLLLWGIRMQAGRKILGATVLFDVAALTTLLALSGGAGNPFGLLYIVHVAVAAVLLGERWTWVVSVVSTVLYGALFFVKIDIPELSHQHGGSHEMHMGGSVDAFSLHLQGMWFAFGLVSIVLASFFTRLLKSLRAREEELKESEVSRLKYERLALVTTLAANAAHELNTPLATIGLAAGEILAGRELPSGIQRDAELIQREVRRCACVLERLRLNAGDVEGEVPQEVSIYDLLEELHERMTEEDRARVRLDDESEDLSALAPRRSLVEALLALIRNALEAAPRSPVILSFSRKGREQSFTVTDAGSGMTPAELAKLGQPFFTTKGDGAGLGLGVFLARAFADRMKGQLDFLSSEKRGTRATLSLPVVT